MDTDSEDKNKPSTAGAPSLISSVDTIKSRIESELTTLRTRIDVKKEKLAKLMKKVDEVRKARENGDSMLDGEGRQKLVESLAERTLHLESDIQDVERITLSTNHARKSCHVPVYISKTNCVYFMVSPGVTCFTLVHQILGAMLHSTPALDDKHAKYLRMRRRGEKDPVIIREMRRDKVTIEPSLFEAPEYTLVCNQGRKPGSWEEIDLLSPELRHEDAIHFLTSLALDPARGFGVNGSSIVEQSRPLRNPNMLPPLYFVKRASQGFVEKEELAAALASTYNDSKNCMSGTIGEIKSSSSSVQNENAAIAGVPLAASQPSLEDNLPKGLAPKQKNMSAYYSLADDRSFGTTTRASGNDQNSFAGSIGVNGAGSSMQRPPTLKSWTENPEKDEEEAGGGSFRRLPLRVKECFRWCMAPRVSRLSRFQTSRFDMSAQTQSSAFEAFATLILFGEPVDGNHQSTLRIENTKQRRERILSKAADLMDFAWLGRESASARLYCKQLGLALGLNRPPRHIWSMVFSGITHGSGDRLAHSVDFDEFHMQYLELRSAPYVEDDQSAVTYGDKMDELVWWFKSELKATYRLVDVPIPPKIWGRRFRTIAMLVAFVILIVASLENSNNLVEIAGSFPDALHVQNNFTETYDWSRSACRRLARSDISDVVLRQQRVSAQESTKCPKVQLLPEFNLHDPNTTSVADGEWSSFQDQVFLATSAHGRFSDYDDSGYVLSNTGKGRYGAFDSGLDVSTRSVLLDFDLYNEALNVAAHGEYVTEFDSSGNVVSRLVLSSKSTNSPSSGENGGLGVFKIYAIIATVLIGAAALVTTFQFLLSLRANSTLERFPFTTLFVIVAFGTSLPLIFLDYNSNLLAVSSLSLAYCLGVMMYSLERSWMWVLSVFDNNRLRLFSIFVQYALFVLLYTVALEGWYNDRTYLTFHYGQTAVAASIFGIVPGYIHLLFPRNQNDFGDAISVLFGLIFVLVAGTLIYVFFAIVIFGFRSKPHDPNWGLFSVKSRRMYQPVE